MNKYALAARITVERNAQKMTPDMSVEWQLTMNEIFPNQMSSRKKGCPRGAFLGLCEEGLIKGIPAGDYGLKPASVNKYYAVKAADLLLSGEKLGSKSLWARVTDPEKKHNSQMDIVLELHRHGYLFRS
ncbi:DUF6979 family protein [Cedecea davisae]|uniref:DUF6979 family protein n=1 Tax=Cedecea davisae TaxID=158484 RepID=UPI00242ECBEE|nr:hypothetical protein [Cedecea davisae]